MAGVSLFWTTARLARLRRLWEAGRSWPQIAAGVGTTVAAVKTAANRRLRLVRRRPFTAAEVRTVRREYGKTPCRALAATLGRTEKSVYLKALALGLTRTKFAWTSAGERTLRRMHAAGHSDAEISAELRCERHVVGDRRLKLGLPTLAGVKGCEWHPRLKRKVAAGVRRQLDRAGADSLADVRADAYRRYAAECGWPEHLPPRAVQILNLLAERGPMTRRQMAAALGLKCDGPERKLLTAPRQAGASYTACLLREGLVLTQARNAKGQGKGHKRPGLYMLTPAAIELREVWLVQRETEDGPRTGPGPDRAGGVGGATAGDGDGRRRGHGRRGDHAEAGGESEGRGRERRQVHPRAGDGPAEGGGEEGGAQQGRQAKGRRR